MTKQIACPVCSGHGFISVIGENTISSYTCDHCNGAGEIEIPMTNADRIRAMSDYELADILYKFAHSNNKPLNKGNLFGWLKQPAEGE